MRTTAMTAPTKTAGLLPRGWVVLGMAFASWLVVAALWTAMSQVFSLVAGTI